MRAVLGHVQRDFRSEPLSDEPRDQRRDTRGAHRYLESCGKHELLGYGRVCPRWDDLWASDARAVSGGEFAVLCDNLSFFPCVFCVFVCFVCLFAVLSSFQGEKGKGMKK